MPTVNKNSGKSSRRPNTERVKNDKAKEKEAGKRSSSSSSSDKGKSSKNSSDERKRSSRSAANSDATLERKSSGSRKSSSSDPAANGDATLERKSSGSRRSSSRDPTSSSSRRASAPEGRTSSSPAAPATTSPARAATASGPSDSRTATTAPPLPQSRGILATPAHPGARSVPAPPQARPPVAAASASASASTRSVGGYLQQYGSIRQGDYGAGMDAPLAETATANNSFYNMNQPSVNSMYGAGPAGGPFNSMYGTGAGGNPYSSMYGAADKNSISGPNQTGSSLYGATGPGSAYGMSKQDTLAGGNSAYNARSAGSFFGPGGANPTSLYGTNAGEQANGSFSQQPGGTNPYPSAYGAGAMRGGGGPGSNSGYGSGFPGMYGSGIYGSQNSMNRMCSMNRMGSLGRLGSQRSLYDMSTLGRYNSMGLGSNYTSLYNIGRVSSRSSFRSTSGHQGPYGLFREAPNSRRPSNKDGLGSFMGPDGLMSEIPPMSTKLYQPATSLPGETPRSANGRANGSRSIMPAPATGPASAPPVSDLAPAAERKAGESREAAERDSNDNRSRAAPAAVLAAAAAAEAARVSAVPPRTLSRNVNDQVHAIGLVDSKALMKGDRSIRMSDGSSYEVDEISTKDVLDIERSDILTDLVENVYCGHNVSILTFANTDTSLAMGQEVTLKVLREVVGRMDKATAAGDTYEMWAISAAFPDPASPDAGRCRDLLALPIPAVPTDYPVGQSPIFGPGVMELAEVHVYDASDMAETVTNAVVTSRGNELVLTTFKLKQVRSAEGRRDVYVSAITVAVIRGASYDHVPAIIAGGKSMPATLFSQAVGGASRTVVLAPVSAFDKQEDRVQTLMQAAALRGVSNPPIRSGSVSRFIDYTQTTLDKKVAAGSNLASRALKRIKLILIDSKDLCDNTARVAPKLYPVPQDDESNPLATRATPAPPRAAVTAAAPTTATAAPAPPAEPADAPAKPTVSRTIVPTAAPAAASNAAAAAETAPAAPAKPMVTRAAVASQEITLPDETIAFGVVVEKSDETACFAGRSLNLPVAGGTTAVIPTDELTERTEADQSVLPDCGLVNRTISRLLSGYNASLLSAETVRSIPLQNQVTWKAFDKIVTAALSNSAPGVIGNEVDLYMMVIRQREVVMDVISDKGGFPLTVATSPLFGALPNETSPAHLTEATMASPVISAALAKASTHLSVDNADDDTMVVAVAVYKMMMQEDLFVSSLFCMSTPSPKVFNAIVANDSRYSRSLFSYAVGGVSVSTVLMVTDSLGVLSTTGDTAKATEMVRAVATKSKNMKSRDGSVNRYLRHTINAVEQSKKKIASASDDREKEKLQKKLDVPEGRMTDHKALADAPRKVTAPAYLSNGDRQHGRRDVASAASTAVAVVPAAGPVAAAPAATPVKPRSAPAEDGSRVYTVVTVVHDRDGDEALTVTDTTVSAGPSVTVTPSEVINQEGRVIRCNAIDELVQKHAAGYNVAFIAADAAHCTVGRTLATKLARAIPAALPTAASEAYWCVIVMNGGGELKDILATADGRAVPYEKVRYGSSPVFGPIPYNTTLALLEPEAVEARLREAVMERNASGGVVVATIVSKVVPDSKDDVAVPSCMIVLLGDDASPLTDAIGKDARQRGFLSYALGGMCRTVYSVGVHSKQAAGSVALLESVPMVGAVKNPPLRHCSLRQVADYLRRTVTNMEKNVGKATGSQKDEDAAKLTNVKHMLEDAEAVLEAPASKNPPYYPR